MLTKSLSDVETGYQGLTFEDMLQNSKTCGILVVDSEEKVTISAPDAGRVLHLSTTPEQTLTVSELPETVRTLIRKAQLTRKMAVGRQILTHPNSPGAGAVTVTVIPVSTNVTVVVLEEILSAKKVENNLRRLDRLAAVGTLSASMAHEIKNALVAVRTFVDLLLEKNQDQEFGGTVRREMTRMDSIVTHMLKFGAPAQPKFSSLHLHQVLEHSLRLVQYRVEHKRIEFKREFNASTDVFSGDDHQLEQVFVNLMFNAIEATGPEGTVTVTTDWIPDGGEMQLNEGAGTSPFIRVKIVDTGAGISPENLAHIFEPFFTTKQNGTGLGLAVTRRIIEEHKGSVHVESCPGKGTTFVVFLPALVKSGPG